VITMTSKGLPESSREARILATLREQYKGRWDIWYVSHVVKQGGVWCAKPAGTRFATINVESVEALVAEIARQEAWSKRDSDLSQWPNAGLQNAWDEINSTYDATPADPSSQRFALWKQLSLIDEELTKRPSMANIAQSSCSPSGAPKEGEE